MHAVGRTLSVGHSVTVGHTTNINTTNKQTHKPKTPKKNKVISQITRVKDSNIELKKKKGKNRFSIIEPWICGIVDYIVV